MAHFGWTWEYLHWGIRWMHVQKMMVDAPRYDYDTSKGKPGKESNRIRLSSDNIDDTINFFNSLPR